MKEGAIPTILDSECSTPKRRKCDEDAQIVDAPQSCALSISPESQKANLLLELNELRQKLREANEKQMALDINNQKLVVENNKLKTRIKVQSELISNLKAELKKITSERDKLETVFKTLVSEDYLPPQAMSILQVGNDPFLDF